MAFELPKLPYAKDALEPYISEETIDIHYGKHHQAYVNNVNNLVKGTEFENATLEEIIVKTDGGIFNNAAQVWNHTFYWNCMAPGKGGAATGAIADKINAKWGSFDKFKEEFKSKKQPIALVTVTKVLGSAPCKVASKMIVTNQKEIFGTIGGGKLEFQVIDEAINAINENKIKEFAYTLGPEFEQCCGGKVEFIIEPMNQSPELFLFGAGHIGVEICNLLANTPFQVCLIDSREDWFSDINLNQSIQKCPVNENDFKTFNDVVKTTIFITDMNDFGEINEVYGSYFNEDNAPARETVQVAKLPKNVHVEISMIAVK